MFDGKFIDIPPGGVFENTVPGWLFSLLSTIPEVFHFERYFA